MIGALLATLVPSAKGAQTPTLPVQANTAAAEAAALAFMTSRAGTFGLSSSDVNDVVVADRAVSDRSGVTSVHLQQRYPEGAENVSLQATVLVAGTVTGRVICSLARVPAADRSSRVTVGERRQARR